MKKFFLLLSAALLLNVSGFCQNVNQLFNKINNEVRDTYAPDERDKTYEVALIDNKGKLTLVGSTTEKEAVDALLAKLSKAGIKAENKIDVLPSKKLNGKTYGIVCMSTASFNCGGSFSAESGTQALMGMPVRILEENNDDWYRCINMEGYTAWVITRSVKAMTEEEYGIFINELIHAETAEVHGFEESRVFEGCMPIESMAKRGFMVPAFGPMKPVGLTDPRTGKEPFAVVQLRQDNASDTMYNLVGFQTRLKFGEQKRVFGLIPGLEHAEFARYGVMHRNTFLNSPGFLNASFEMISRENCFFAGQITGVEGYVESAGSGLVAGMTLAARLNHTEVPVFPSCTALGAMGKHVSTPNPNFQPMNCSFGLIDPLPVVPGEKRPRKKQDRYEAVAQRALACVRDIQSKTGGIS